MSQLQALGLTLVVELAVGLALGPRPRTSMGWWRLAAIVAACSLVTHPLAWQLNLAAVRVLSFAERATVVEAAVIVVEAVLLRLAVPLGWRRAFVVSLTMNVASFGVGWLLR